jgi:hypothetical protein
MDDLLKLAIEAHGGLERWRQFKEVRANVSITGALWHLKGQPDVLKNVQVVAQLHRQHMVTHLIGKDRRTIFTTGQVSIESESGVVEETRVDPTTSFRGQNLETPWDALHVAYFASYALWSYLTIPFLYSYPGFVSEEVAPWEEDGEQWRPYRSPFPIPWPATRGIKFRISVLTDCCGGTNIPWMFLAMLRDSTTPPTTEPQTESWCHTSAEYLLMTAKSER